jgi:hypothetical protein
MREVLALMISFSTEYLVLLVAIHVTVITGRVVRQIIIIIKRVRMLVRFIPIPFLHPGKIVLIVIRYHFKYIYYITWSVCGTPELHFVFVSQSSALSGELPDSTEDAVATKLVRSGGTAAIHDS